METLKEQPQVPQQDAPPASPADDSKKAVDPELEKQTQAYVMGLSRILHNENTSPQVMAMLKSGDPATTVPHAALLVNQQMEDALRGKGQPPSLDVLVGGAQFLVSDLVEMGNAAGVFKIDTPQQLAPILKDTMQQYITSGLKNGTIDPIELQKKVEPLMTEEHRALGTEAAGRTGLPMEPNQMTAMEAYARQQKAKPAGMLRGGQ